MSMFGDELKEAMKEMAKVFNRDDAFYQAITNKGTNKGRWKDPDITKEQTFFGDKFDGNDVNHSEFPAEFEASRLNFIKDALFEKLKPFEAKAPCICSSSWHLKREDGFRGFLIQFKQHSNIISMVVPLMMDIEDVLDKFNIYSQNLYACLKCSQTATGAKYDLTNVANNKDFRIPLTIKKGGQY